MQRFSKDSVCRGLQENEFSTLDEKTRKKLVVLMARVSEASFRRGFQSYQALHNTGQPLVDALHLRYETDPDRSPFPDSFFDGQWNSRSGFKATERLFMEYGALSEVGFRDPSL